MNIGFIGIGAMGRPMAVNLLKAGFHLTVYDLNQEAVQQLIEMGACSAATPKELAAGADVVITMLPNFDVVQSVLDGADGVLAGAQEAAVIIDMSTVAPNQTRRMAALAKEKGVSYLDAPVSGGVGGAANGALTIMVGGPAAVIEQVMGIFNVLGKRFIELEMLEREMP